ncbi:hypothetical protein [Psychroserpens algicola]|uniref:Uncharacterized protein n=1 Tax=Psychroserpens algicola TaxID=1719034 RepID=A0ABT0H8N2_9FLAO|nr:hypothetical protein [Psychroserpens algicola]MCK8480721.1 hypothetical protein [Psychroserpens algicola]
MKTLYITLFCCLAFISMSFSQQNKPTASEQKQIERYKEESDRRKEEYITNFMSTLDVDDFQKEIITQSLYDYFDELVKINKLGLKSYERETHIERLDKSHFKDVQAIVSEDVMSQIMDAVKGKLDKKSGKKKRKKKN